MLKNESLISVFDEQRGRFLSIDTRDNTICCTIRSKERNGAIAFQLSVREASQLSIAIDNPVGITDKLMYTKAACFLPINKTFNDLLHPFTLELKVVFLVDGQFNLLMRVTAIEALLNMSLAKTFQIIVLPRRLAGDPYCLSTSDLLVTSYINHNIVQYRLANRDTLCAFKLLTDIYTVLTNRSLLLAVNLKHKINPRTKREYTDEEEDPVSEVDKRFTFLDFTFLSQKYRNISLSLREMAHNKEKQHGFTTSPTPSLDSAVYTTLSDYGVPFQIGSYKDIEYKYRNDHQNALQLYTVFLDTLKYDLLNWTDRSLQEQLMILIKACDTLVSPTTCPVCSLVGAYHYVICHRCSCAIGCCTDCARTHSAMHKAECNMLFPISVLRTMSQEELVDVVEHGNKVLFDSLQKVGTKITMDVEVLFKTWSETRGAINFLLDDAEAVIKETEKYLAIGKQDEHYLQNRLAQEDNKQEYNKIKNLEIKPSYWPDCGFPRLYITTTDLRNVMTNIKETRKSLDITEGINLIKESSQAADDFLIDVVNNEDANVHAVLEFLLDNKSVFPELFTEMIVRMRYAYIEQLTLLKEQIMEIEEEILGIDYQDQIHRFEFIENVSYFVELLSTLNIKALPSFFETEMVVEQAFISDDGRVINLQAGQGEGHDNRQDEKSLQETLIELTDSARSLLYPEMNMTQKGAVRDSDAAQDQPENAELAQTPCMRPLEVKFLKSICLKPQILQLLAEMQIMDESQFKYAPYSSAMQDRQMGKSVLLSERKRLGEGFLSYYSSMKEMQSMLNELKEYCPPGIGVLCSLYKHTIITWPLLTLNFSAVEECMQNAYDTAAFIEAKVCHICDLLDATVNELNQIQIKIHGKHKQIQRLKADLNQVVTTNEGLITQILRRSAAQQDQYLKLTSLPSDMHQLSIKSIGHGYAKISNYALQDLVCISYKQADRIMGAIFLDKLVGLKDVCGVYICKGNKLIFLQATGKYREILSIYIRGGIFYNTPQKAPSSYIKSKPKSRRNSITTLPANPPATESQTPYSTSRRNSIGSLKPSQRSAASTSTTANDQYAEQTLRLKLTKQRVDKLPTLSAKKIYPYFLRSSESPSNNLCNLQSISAQVDDVLRLNNTLGSSQTLEKTSSPCSFAEQGDRLHHELLPFTRLGVMSAEWSSESSIRESTELRSMYPNLIEALAYPEFITGIESACGRAIDSLIFSGKTEKRAAQFLAARQEEALAEADSLILPKKKYEPTGLPPRPKRSAGLSFKAIKERNPNTADSINTLSNSQNQSPQLTKCKATHPLPSEKDIITSAKLLEKRYKQGYTDTLAENAELSQINEETQEFMQKIDTVLIQQSPATQHKLIELRYTCYKQIVRRLWQTMLRTAENAIKSGMSSNLHQLKSILGNVRARAADNDLQGVKKVLTASTSLRMIPPAFRNYIKRWLATADKVSDLLQCIDNKIKSQVLLMLPSSDACNDLANVCIPLDYANVDVGALCLSFNITSDVNSSLFALFDIIEVGRKRQRECLESS